MLSTEFCKDCAIAPAVLSEHLKLWDKALIKALKKGEIYTAQVAEQQIERYCDMLIKAEKNSVQARKRKMV